MIPLQWMYGVLPTWRLHVLNFLLLFCTLIAALVMLASAAPCFALLPYKVWSFSSPLSLLSNSTGLNQFGFFKRELYPISHNALIMDCFVRENLYDMPRVIVSSFSYEIDREETTHCALSTTFYRIPIWYTERYLWRFSQGHVFEMKFRSLQKP